MNLPNKLTVLRCVMTFVFMVVLLLDFPFHYGVALLLFIAASLTDYFDGKIARRDNLITNLKIASHVLDFFISLFLRTNHKEIDDYEHKNEGSECENH
jgi:phosphatidylglycerophosphate synthase